MMELTFDLYQTTALAVAVLFFGKLVRKLIPALTRFCIPAPVVGGLIFSIIALAGHTSGVFSFSFDTTLQSIFMTVFFTSVGYMCEVKQLAKCGKLGIILSIFIVALIVLQDLIGIGVATIFNIHPLLGVIASSAAMFGGHGTAGAFAPEFEALGATGAVAMGMAAATFGLVSGGLIGGPVARRLVRKNNLVHETLLNSTASATVSSSDEEDIQLSQNKMFTASFHIFASMGLGTLLMMFFTHIGVTFPTYMGALFVGMIIRNVGSTGVLHVPIKEITCLGEIGLTMFVTMSLITLELWELATLALPLVVILICQIIALCLITTFIAFPMFGKTYDASVMVCGICGFGMGAMSNAIANMQTFTQKFGPSPNAYLVITTVGMLICDVVNAIVLTAIMGYF